MEEEMEIKMNESGNIDTLREMLKSLGFQKEIVFEKKGDCVFN